MCKSYTVLSGRLPLLENTIAPCELLEKFIIRWFSVSATIINPCRSTATLLGPLIWFDPALSATTTPIVSLALYFTVRLLSRSATKSELFWSMKRPTGYLSDRRSEPGLPLVFPATVTAFDCHVAHADIFNGYNPKGKAWKEKWITVCDEMHWYVTSNWFTCRCLCWSTCVGGHWNYFSRVD